MILFPILLGLCFGSFSSACSYRISHHLPLINDRSRCPHCHHELNWIDLIPLVGFLVRKGNCHYCHHAISLRYPLNELLHALTFLFFAFTTPTFIQFILYSLFLSTVYTLAWIDYDIQMIPISLLILLLLIALFIRYPQNLLMLLFQTILLLTPMSICYLLFPQQLGLGDVLFVGITSLLLPFYQLFVMLLISCMLAIFYLLFQCKQKRKNIDDPLPFIPFLTVGLCLVLFVNFL